MIQLKNNMQLAFFAKSGNTALVTVVAGDGQDAALLVAWSDTATKEDMAGLETMMTKQTGLKSELSCTCKTRDEAEKAVEFYLKGRPQN